MDEFRDLYRGSDPNLTGVDLSMTELMLIEQRVTNSSKSAGAAYLLWLLLWFVSGHRFYLGRPGSAILQIATYFILVGFVWVLVDAFLIPGMVQQDREKTRLKLMEQMRGQKAAVRR